MVRWSSVGWVAMVGADEMAGRDLVGRYRAIFAQVVEGIFLFEAASKRVVEANPAFLRLFDYREADLPVLTLYDLVSHDRAGIDANVARIVRDGHHAIGELL